MFVWSKIVLTLLTVLRTTKNMNDVAISLVFELNEQLASVRDRENEMTFALCADEGEDVFFGSIHELRHRPGLPDKGITQRAFDGRTARPKARSSVRRNEPADTRQDGFIFGEASALAGFQDVRRLDAKLLCDLGSAEQFCHIMNAVNLHRRPPVRCSSSFRPRRSNNPAALFVPESHDPFRSADPVVRGRALAASDSAPPASPRRRARAWWLAGNRCIPWIHRRVVFRAAGTSPSAARAPVASRWSASRPRWHGTAGWASWKARCWIAGCAPKCHKRASWCRSGHGCWWYRCLSAACRFLSIPEIFLLLYHVFCISSITM